VVLNYRLLKTGSLNAKRKRHKGNAFFLLPSRTYNVPQVSTPILAAVMAAPRQPIEVREFSRPDLPLGAALLRTERSEVCGTDVHLWHGRLAGVPYPIIPGHVSAGVLESIRGPLTSLDGSTLREGDRAVFFDVHRTCGRCRACTVHHTPTRCPARRVYGITDSADEGLYGGWSQNIYLEPGVGIARLPDSVTVDDYIGGGCGLLTAVHILERAQVRPDDTVLVQGVGAVGLSAIALSRLAGAAAVLAIGDPAPRLELARSMGADQVFALGDTTAAERLAAVRELTHGEGADVVIEAAGSARAVEEGVTLVRDGGCYVIAGHYTDVGPSSINAHQHINRKHLDIRGCWGSGVSHFLEALRLLERHATTVPWRTIGTRTYSLHSLDRALEDAAAMKLTKALVDPWSQDPRIEAHA
jgi:threonine dehydrogenase-like Zn-dependent dehydrogenase